MGLGPDRADVRAAHRSNSRRLEEVSCRERLRELIGGANMRTSNGVMKQQPLLPIDGAAAVGFVHLVGYLRENGFTTARAQHFAANNDTSPCASTGSVGARGQISLPTRGVVLHAVGC